MTTDADDMSISDDEVAADDAAADLGRIISDSNRAEAQQRPRKRKLHWKTEWMVYCFYTHGL